MCSSDLEEVVEVEEDDDDDDEDDDKVDEVDDDDSHSNTQTIVQFVTQIRFEPVLIRHVYTHYHPH